MRRTISTLLVPLVLGLSAYSTVAQTRKRSDIGGTRSILIAQYMARTGSEALLITDRKRIDELVRLFRNNEAVPHACGYHWIIWFRQSATNAVPFAHNEDCQVYRLYDTELHAVLNSYFSSILKSPKYYVVDVTVPASLSPEDVVTKLESPNQQVFFFNPTDERLPHITIAAKAISKMPVSRGQRDAAEARNLRNAKQQLAIAIRSITSTYTGAKASPPDHRSSRSGGGEIEDTVQSTISFSNTTDPTRIAIPESVRVIERTMPDSYIVQLVVDQPFSPMLCSTLTSKYPFVVHVRAFGDFER